jgi:hypothetical protein
MLSALNGITSRLRLEESYMNRFGVFAFRFAKLGLIGVFIAGGASCGLVSPGPSPAPPQKLAIAPLSADDVSWLFPPPARAEDFAKLIAVRELTTPNAQDPTKRDPVWPDAVFQRFLEIAKSDRAQVAGTTFRIGLPVEAQSIDAWFIAGIRIDAGAPGLSSDIRAQFGQAPEIRLIIQPVTRNADGSPQVHDIAVHLIFNFTLEKQKVPAEAKCLPILRPEPDLDAFNKIVADLADLRTKLSNGQLGANKVSTNGAPLGVHPGLADATTESNLRQEMKAFPERHISGERLAAMAVTGLPAPPADAPWIFLAMAKMPVLGFVPVLSPTLDGKTQFAQMLQPAGKKPRVVPEPHTNNLNPITCANGVIPGSLPLAKRAGVSTAALFVTPQPPDEKINEVTKVIDDPDRSHFFNTDCVSCHTETRRAMDLLKTKEFPGIDTAVLPNSQYAVRNFGWSPGSKGSFQPTVTRRTAAETAAVVTFINSELLAKQAVTNH